MIQGLDNSVFYTKLNLEYFTLKSKYGLDSGALFGEGRIGNRVQLPSGPATVTRSLFQGCHWVTGKAQRDDDTKSGDLPGSGDT